jgi:hypothetical protein
VGLPGTPSHSRNDIKSGILTEEAVSVKTAANFDSHAAAAIFKKLFMPYVVPSFQEFDLGTDDLCGAGTSACLAAQRESRMTTGVDDALPATRSSLEDVSGTVRAAR